MILSFKKTCALTVTVVVIGALSVYGISLIASVETTAAPTSSVIGRGRWSNCTLKLTLTLEKTEFELGEPVNITISLETYQTKP